MNEEALPSEPQEIAASETLDDVISEFNIGNDPTPTPVESPTEPQFTPQTTIDPYDSESIQKFVDGKHNALQHELEQMRSQFSAIQNEKAQAQMEADIKQAVGTLTKSVDGLDPDLAEAFLEMKARKDSNFREIWNNRHSKPQALEKAMGVISSEAKSKFSIKTDEQLVENQRAMKQSMQTNLNQTQSSGNSYEDRLSAASSVAERDRIRREIMESG